MKKELERLVQKSGKWFKASDGSEVYPMQVGKIVVSLVNDNFFSNLFNRTDYVRQKRAIDAAARIDLTGKVNAYEESILEKPYKPGLVYCLTTLYKI